MCAALLLLFFFGAGIGQRQQYQMYNSNTFPREIDRIYLCVFFAAAFLFHL